MFLRPLSAQTQPSAALTVTTRTLQGQAVAKAEITVQTVPGNPSSPAISPHTTETSASGEAKITGLAPGRYRVTIAAKSFDELTTDIDIEPPSADAPATAIDAILTTGGAHKDSITVQGVIETPLEEANTPTVLERQQVRNLPDRPRTVGDALPLAPGIVRLPNGQLRLSGGGEHRSALLVNSANATDPATGQFGATVPIDSVRTMNVLTSPFLAEYGGFTADVVAVETRKGGDKWTFELNDPLPEFRWRSWHMVGLRSSTPRVSFGGPLKANRLFVLESIQYEMRENPVITLPFPNNEFRREGYNSLTAFDYTLNNSNLVTATFHLADQHVRFNNLDFFNPQPVSPTTADSTAAADVTEHAAFHGTLLDSGISASTYRDGVWPQGDLAMILTPSRNAGNYFSRQTRTSSRVDWRETWSFSKQFLGTHNLKFGSLLGGSTEHAQVEEHPVNIYDAAGALIENIAFTPGLPISRSDVESAFFGQDQWVFNSRVSINLGLRAGQQEVTDVFRLGPRAGLVLTPFANGHTIIRAGAGVFYDRVPLNVYGFAFYPDQIITQYNSDGSILSGPFRYFNLTEPAAPHHSPLIYRSNNVPGNFAPYSINSNLQIEQILSPRLRIRANYLLSHSEELIVVAPRIDNTAHAFVLNGSGNSRFRQVEFTAAATAGKESQIYLTYTRSYSVGNLNEFNTYLASFPPAVILPDAHTFLPGNAPDRFLAWGTLAFPMKLRLMPKVEYRSGFPWSPLTPAQEYVGVPNQSSFPGSFSVDARVTKDFKVTDKYSFRFGVSGSNLTNHFNPISVHANTGDPDYGVFFGEYRRRYTADFDVLF
ncbi:MAG TPA: carboxypeptidase regulatory-like domain-containing protein [Bryobacteraceae bacterium]|nr:carboxypeptidase regulatory-like domain-containing protein [Bryobacteraceae bacterium]